jgi:hypothetical protein
MFKCIQGRRNETRKKQGFETSQENVRRSIYRQFDLANGFSTFAEKTMETWSMLDMERKLREFLPKCKLGASLLGKKVVYIDRGLLR